MKVLIIQTGGTIDKCYPQNVGGYNFEIGDSYAWNLISRFTASNANPSNDEIGGCTFISLCKKDSQDITNVDREQLLDVILHSGAKKVLVTHGTDTLLDTARFCAQELVRNKDQRIVVFVGSLKPGTFKDTDADFQVGFALGALAALEVTESTDGVYIAMNGHFMRHYCVRRCPQTGHFIPTSVVRMVEERKLDQSWRK